MPKMIIWGHKLYSHTHSFIHYGFYRAFKYLGYETLWLDDNDDVSGIDFSNSIFLAEGGSSKKMPLLKDCMYILHNCPNYEGIGKSINIQYLTYQSVTYQEVSHGITFKDGCLYFPWGSPLLPYEFNEFNLRRTRLKGVYFIGTVNPRNIGNFENIEKFATICTQKGHVFYAGGGYTGKVKESHITYLNGIIKETDQKKYYQKAYMAPAIQGDNQLGNGMVPCRLFKAISYGNDGISNNSLANDLFNGQLVYNPDCTQLYLDAEKCVGTNMERRKYLFNLVRSSHTYINTINAILKVL